MPASTEPPIMDIFPWPEGHGFSGAQLWWQQLLNQSDEQKLDYLMGIALLSHEVCNLLLKHDEALLAAMQFSETTMLWLQEIVASSLDEFAAAIALKRNLG